MRKQIKHWTKNKASALLGEGLALLAVASGAERLLANDSPWARWSAESVGFLWAWAAQSLMFAFGVIGLIGLALVGQGIAQAKRRALDALGTPGVAVPDTAIQKEYGSGSRPSQGGDQNGSGFLATPAAKGGHKEALPAFRSRSR